MAFPASVLSLADAIGSQFLSVFFGGSVGHAAGINLMKADLVAALTKLGISEASAADTPVANTVLASSTNTKSKWRQIVTGDISSSAGILATQLAAGAANTVLIGGASNSFSASPTVSGTLTAANLTATSAVQAGTALYASNQSTYGMTVQSTASLANLSSLTFGAGFGWLYIINNSTGAMCSVECQGALNTVLQHSAAATGFNINSDAGANIAIYHNGSAYAVKNRSGGALAITVIKIGS